MEEYFIIKSFFKTEIKYFFDPDDSKLMYNSSRIWSDNIWGSTKFKNEEEAIDQLKEGREKYHWGGIYQIQKIYISR